MPSRDKKQRVHISVYVTPGTLSSYKTASIQSRDPFLMDIPILNLYPKAPFPNTRGELYFYTFVDLFDTGSHYVALSDLELATLLTGLEVTKIFPNDSWD